METEKHSESPYKRSRAEFEDGTAVHKPNGDLVQQAGIHVYEVGPLLTWLIPA